MPRPADLQSSALPRQVDVAIVGGGYTGLNAARVLKRSGASIAVLERNTVGWGASSRNGGMLTPGIKAPVHVMIDRYGLEIGRAFWQASLDAIDLVEEVVAEEKIDCDFRRCGHVGLAYKASHFDEMKKRAEWYRDVLGYETRVVEPSELRQEIGSDNYFGGRVYEYSAGIHPAKYVLGLGAALARQGVCLCEHTDVVQIKRNSRGFEVETSQGTLSAGEVLIATNGYTDMLVSRLKPRTFPVGSYIVVTEPLPAELIEELSPQGRMFYDSKHFLNYFRVTPDGRMLFGGRNNLSTDLDLMESARLLGRRMVEVFPQLADMRITHTWTGKLGMTFDLMPHIGRIDGLHYALGYCGHGVSIATYVGAEAGKLLAGEQESSPFAEIFHPTRFFYRRSPWFLPFAAWYYRFLDWVS